MPAFRHARVPAWVRLVTCPHFAQVAIYRRQELLQGRPEGPQAGTRAARRTCYPAGRKVTMWAKMMSCHNVGECGMHFEGIPKPMNRLESIVGIGINTREDYRGEELSRKQKRATTWIAPFTT